VESLACPDRSQTPRFLPLLLVSLLLVLLPFLVLLGRSHCCFEKKNCRKLLAAWSPWRALIGRKLLAFYRCCSCRCCWFCCRSCMLLGRSHCCFEKKKLPEVACCVESLACPDRSQTPRFLPLLLVSLLLVLLPFLVLLGRSHCCFEKKKLPEVACCVESLACPDRSQTPRFLPLLLVSLLLVLLPFLVLLGRSHCCFEKKKSCRKLLAAWSPWRALIGRKLLAFYRCCSCRCCWFCCRSWCC
jgi:hypothetical protein